MEAALLCNIIKRQYILIFPGCCSLSAFPELKGSTFPLQSLTFHPVFLPLPLNPPDDAVCPLCHLMPG